MAKSCESCVFYVKDILFKNKYPKCAAAYQKKEYYSTLTDLDHIELGGFSEIYRKFHCNGIHNWKKKDSRLEIHWKETLVKNYPLRYVFNAKFNFWLRLKLHFKPSQIMSSKILLKDIIDTFKEYKCVIRIPYEKNTTEVVGGVYVTFLNNSDKMLCQLTYPELFW